MLGAVTCAANTLRVQTITASGNITTVVKGDSVAAVVAPRSGRGHARGAVGHGTAAPCPADTAAASTALGATRKRAMRPEGVQKKEKYIYIYIYMKKKKKRL